MYYLFTICQVICLFVYIGKNPWFTAFLDSNIHTRLAIVSENKVGLAFPSRNLPQKKSSRSVYVLFSYRGNKQTDRQTDKPTPEKNIIPRFLGDKKLPWNLCEWFSLAACSVQELAYVHNKCLHCSLLAVTVRLIVISFTSIHCVS